MSSEQTPWVVKGVPEYIRRKVKIYAVQQNVTMAQAVEDIVNLVIAGSEQEILRNPQGSPYSPYPLPAGIHKPTHEAILSVVEQERLIDREMPSWLRDIVDKHLRECPECAKTAASIRRSE